MELWIPLTIAAAFAQNLRSALQRSLTGALTPVGASYVRFAYALPFALAYTATLSVVTGNAIQLPSATFWIYAAGGGTAQMIGTALLLLSFTRRNFAVGTALSKTETVQTVLFGVLILGEGVSALAWLAIAVSLCGVVGLSAGKAQPGTLGASDPTGVLLGLGTGAAFGVAAVGYRGASLTLSGGFLFQASLTLSCVLLFQTLAMAAWIAWREPGQLREVARQWRRASLAGLAGAAASAGWFSAMTLKPAAYVRALGQIELVFTFAASIWVFGELPTRLEWWSIALIVLGIGLLLIG